jgi:hypothetical protein
MAGDAEVGQNFDAASAIEFDAEFARETVCPDARSPNDVRGIDGAAGEDAKNCWHPYAAPCNLVEKRGTTRRRVSVARGRALRASLGFASAPALVC